MRPKTKKIKHCLLCKNKKLKKIFSLGNLFVSNFVNKAKIKKGIKAPLTLLYCKNCTLIQLSHIAPQEIMYKRIYWYKSGITKTMREGLKEIFNDSLKFVKLSLKEIKALILRLTNNIKYKKYEFLLLEIKIFIRFIYYEFKATLK